MVMNAEQDDRDVVMSMVKQKLDLAQQYIRDNAPMSGTNLEERFASIYMLVHRQLFPEKHGE
jgi:hypothetical protein